MCKIIYSQNYGKYNLGPGHPFDPIRIEITLDLLHELGYAKNFIEPEAVTAEALTAIHDKEYIQVVEALSSGEQLAGVEKFGIGTSDNPVIQGMTEGARYQAGGTLLGAKLLVDNKAKKILQFGGGFHHAHYNFASGFCLYNDLALAIKQMINAGWHIAYLDIDVHHGDGVQEIFYSDDKVMTISLHESGEYLFPGTGFVHELGQGMGRYLKLNIPLEPFTEGDSYSEVLTEISEHALSWFKPDALIVMAGADAHYSDPLADLMLTTKDYEKIFKKIIELSDVYCKGRALFTLGGGYSITVTPKIWAMLYLLLFGYEIPEKVPVKWQKRWKEKLGKEVSVYFHDPYLPYQQIVRKNEIDRKNQAVMQHIRDLVWPHWL